MDLPTKSPMPARRRKLWLFLVIAAVLLLGGEGLYTLAAARYLRSADLVGRLNRKPERFRIGWREARSPWPGWLVVHDLELAGRTRRVRWSLHADVVEGALHLPSLLNRRALFRGVEASGVAVRIARILPSGAPPLEGQPEIVPAFSATPEEFETMLAAPRNSRWTIELQSVAMRRIRELWVERWRATGAMAARGGLKLRLGRDAQVFPTRLDLLDAEISVVGLPAASGVRGNLEAATDPFSPRRERGWAAMRHVSGSLQLDGRLRSLRFLVGLMPKVPWLSLEGGEGDLRSHVRFVRGRLEPGGDAQIRAHAAKVEFLDYQARGEALLTWRAERGGMTGQAELSRCEIRRHGASVPYATAPRLTLAFASPDLDLDGRLTEVSARADLPVAEVPDLRYYNSYLPAGAGVKLTGGRGRLATHVEIAPTGRARGRISLTTQDVAATARRLALAGRCRVAVAIASEDVRSGRFALDGTEVRCDEVTVQRTEGGKPPSSTNWWAKGTLREGFVAPGTERFLAFSGAAEARDALPLFALFGDRPGARIAAHFFRDKAVAATGRVELSSASWRAVGQGQAGPRLTAEARLTGKEGRIEGALLARIGRRRLGIELMGGGRKIHWRRAEAWFASGVGANP